MDKYIQIFIDFIPSDKGFIDSLMPKYKGEFRTLGEYIEKHSTSLNCKDDEFLEELLDFLDGNGFEVIRPKVKDPYDTHPIQLKPIYIEKIHIDTITLEEEIKKINEELKETIKKVQSAVSEYIPVQEVTLSYTSMEMDEGPVLEYEELYTPRPLWICLHRCLEFLRLVSAGWSRSTALPRPP